MQVPAYNPNLNIHEYAKMRASDLVLIIRALLSKIIDWAKSFFFKKEKNISPNKTSTFLKTVSVSIQTDAPESTHPTKIEKIQNQLQFTKDSFNRAMNSVFEKAHKATKSFPTPTFSIQPIQIQTPLIKKRTKPHSENWAIPRTFIAIRDRAKAISPKKNCLLIEPPASKSSFPEKQEKTIQDVQTTPHALERNSQKQPPIKTLAVVERSKSNNENENSLFQPKSDPRTEIHDDSKDHKKNLASQTITPKLSVKVTIQHQERNTFQNQSKDAPTASPFTRITSLKSLRNLGQPKVSDERTPRGSTSKIQINGKENQGKSPKTHQEIKVSGTNKTRGLSNAGPNRN